MFEVNTNTTWAIFAYEGVADVGYKMSEWMNNPEKAKETWLKFKRNMLGKSHHYKAVSDSRYSLTIVKDDGTMITYAIETWI